MFLMIENAVGEGFKVLGLGMGIVIAVLLILMISLYLLLPIFRRISGGKKEKIISTADAPSPAVENTAADDECDVVAAIIAAIAAQTGASPASLKVVSFKRLK